MRYYNGIAFDFEDDFILASNLVNLNSKASLDYYAFQFNESLFRYSEESAEIQKFKREAGIEGRISLCKYLEYYLRNVVPESLANASHKERLLDAKRYCEKHNR